jgi:hypothetical protein
MNDQHDEKIIRLLEEIRDGQRLQLERQAQALERQAEILAQQREHLAGMSKRAGQAQNIEDGAERVLVKTAKLVSRARLLTFVVLPFAVLLLAFLTWVLFAQLAP